MQYIHTYSIMNTKGFSILRRNVLYHEVGPVHVSTQHCTHAHRYVRMYYSTSRIATCMADEGACSCGGQIKLDGVLPPLMKGLG